MKLDIKMLFSDNTFVLQDFMIEVKAIVSSYVIKPNLLEHINMHNKHYSIKISSFQLVWK